MCTRELKIKSTYSAILSTNRYLLIRCMCVDDKRLNCHHLSCSISYITPLHFHSISINEKSMCYKYVCTYVCSLKERERDKNLPDLSSSFFISILNEVSKKKCTHTHTHDVYHMKIESILRTIK